MSQLWESMKSSATIFKPVHQVINSTYIPYFRSNLFCAIIYCYFHKSCLIMIYRKYSFASNFIFTNTVYEIFMFLYSNQGLKNMLKSYSQLRYLNSFSLIFYVLYKHKMLCNNNH